MVVGTSSLAFLLCSSLLSLLSFPSHAHLLKTCEFNAIYQFGNSISDTGNLIRENPQVPCSHLPYGQTFFKKPTGRCSNGLLIIDYFALAAGLPFLNPYLSKEASFIHGVNFAVAGATALPFNVLIQKNVISLVTNTSLNKQLDWMFTYFNATCSHKRDCIEKLKRALFFVGEIGGNDYNFALFEGNLIPKVRNLVPEVVQAIKDATKRVINHGAVRIIVPGYFPIGCLPVFLTSFQNTNDLTTYDKFHCLKDFNNLARYHNKKLKKAIATLRRENPNVIIIYGDYYNAFVWILQHASLLGFDEASLQKSCCGIGGDYNFNIMHICGLPGVPVCSNPNKYISWDGVHLTQKAYQYMSYWLIHDIFPKLSC